MAQVSNAAVSNDNILKQSCKYLRSIDLNELKKRGISRDKFDYELVYFYPPQRTLGPVNASDVFHCNLKATQPSRDIGMYIHIPFCTGRCSYCHYVRFGPASPKVVEKYIKQLKCELEILSSKPFLNNVRLTNLHIGGGTPTLLDNQHIADLLSFIRHHFEIANDAEITWESSPETIIREHAAKLETLLENGVNRLNIGIQAFEDHLLRLCNRRHSAADAVESIIAARRSGFNNINIDVMYGLPHQTIENWQHTLDKIEELLPESVTIYHLRVQLGTKFAELPAAEFPSEDICLLMQIYGYKRLEQLGYAQIQPCQFILSSANTHRYVIDKWGKGAEFIGVGVSAYGYINGRIYVNHRTLKSYFDAVQSKVLPVYLGEELSKEQRMAKALILGLKVVPFGVNKQEFQDKFGMTVTDVFGKVLTKLERLGLIDITSTSIKLTTKGILFADEVCTEFYTEEEKLKLKRENINKYGCYLQ